MNTELWTTAHTGLELVYIRRKPPFDIIFVDKSTGVITYTHKNKRFLIDKHTLDETLESEEYIMIYT